VYLVGDARHVLTVTGRCRAALTFLVACGVRRGPRCVLLSLGQLAGGVHPSCSTQQERERQNSPYESSHAWKPPFRQISPSATAGTGQEESRRHGSGAEKNTCPPHHVGTCRSSTNECDVTQHIHAQVRRRRVAADWRRLTPRPGRQRR